MKLEFGCGESPTKAGYKSCDIRSLPNIDFVCPAWEITSLVPEESVECVYSRHFFEHLTFKQGELFLRALFEILIPDGQVEMVLPNMNFHVLQYVMRRNAAYARGGFWGWQRGALDDTWDVHKSGYNYTELNYTVSVAGFEKFKRASGHTFSKHLHVTFNKPARG